MMKLSRYHVDTESLLSVTPKEIAESLLIRRRALKDQLPNIIKNLDNESEALTPKLAKIREKNQKKPKEDRDQAAYREPITKSRVKRNLTLRRNINGG